VILFQNQIELRNFAGFKVSVITQKSNKTNWIS